MSLSNTCVFTNTLIGIVIGIIVTIIIYQIGNYSSQPSCYDLDTIINILVRQAARWSTAATQDKNALIATLHANYGAAYLWALKAVATDSQIINATNINPQKFEQAIVSAQDNSTKKMIKLCPSLVPQSYLATIGGEGL
jgi:hypothetical protein